MSVHCIPAGAFSVLEFDKVLDRLSRFCLGPKAAGRILALLPESATALVEMELRRAHEAQQILMKGERYLSHSYADLSEILEKVSVAGYILDAPDILEIRRLLALAQEASGYFRGEAREEWPALTAVADTITDTGDLVKQINRIFDEQGEVRADASKKLLKIARDLQSASQRCGTVFQQLIRKYSSKSWLADTLESVRNERRVLAVKAEYKRQIRGILHDQSASGRTVLIEPEEVIGINNDIFDLRADYKAEVRHLLLELCNAIRAGLPAIQANEDIVMDLDIHLAKGHLGKLLNANVPKLDPEPRLAMRTAYHPLLLLRNLDGDRKTIPFDLDLHSPNRILLLSGPNAGGKSILMKAVGLLQLMVQSGIPVPVSSHSVFGMFEQISASLGDHQSLENDLSTYSSKLGEMRECLEHASGHSLVLVDEFGSGTDPRLGGAIAEGILEMLVKRKAFGVITTHYSELKAYAYRTRGVVNGAMVFDKEHLEPTYELRVGKPGSSYTFEIASKSGLPGEVLEYAGKKTSGLNLRAMEDLLADLDKQKTKLNNETQKAEQRSKQLDQLVQSYERLQGDLTAQRHRIRLEQKEQDYAHLSELNRELERTIRELKEEGNIEAAKQKMQEVRDERTKARDEIGEIHKTLRKTTGKPGKPLEVGDAVRLHDGSHTGKIERIRKKKATVIIGQLRMDVPLDELLPAGEPLEVKSSPSVQTHTHAQENFNPKLDLRGMRPDDARELMERFLDLALVSNAPYVEIIHGKGTGALRRMVVEKLREYPTREISHPEDPQGGSGMTVVVF